MSHSLTIESACADPGTLLASIGVEALIVIDGDGTDNDQALLDRLTGANEMQSVALLRMAVTEIRDRARAGVVLVPTIDGRHTLLRWGHLRFVAWLTTCQIAVSPTEGSTTLLQSVTIPSDLLRVDVSPDPGAPLQSGGTNDRASFRCGRLRVAFAADEHGDTEELNIIGLAQPGAPREPLPIHAGDVPPESHQPDVAPAEPHASVMVVGIPCPQGHHNHSDAVTCALCGRRMGINRTVVPQWGARPSLGVLLLDDGTTQPVRTDLVVGRDPHQHSDVVSGAALPVVITDPKLELSRAHLAIRLEDWTVNVTDLDSSNGTSVERNGVRLAAVSSGERQRLEHGDVIQAGSRRLTIQLHHERP